MNGREYGRNEPTTQNVFAFLKLERSHARDEGHSGQDLREGKRGHPRSVAEIEVRTPFLLFVPAQCERSAEH